MLIVLIVLLHGFCVAEDLEDPFPQFQLHENNHIFENPVNKFFQYSGEENDNTELLNSKKDTSVGNLPVHVVDVRCNSKDINNNANFYKDHLVRFINLFLKHTGLNEKKLDNFLKVEASQEDLEVLKKFVSGDNISILDVDKSYSSVFITFNPVIHGQPWIDLSQLSFSHNEMRAIFVLFPIIISIFWLVLKEVSLKKICTIIIFMLYIIVVSHSLWKQYQDKVIERMEHLKKLTNQKCTGSGTFGSFLFYNVLSFIYGEDPCRIEIKIHESNLLAELDLNRALVEPINLIFNIFVLFADTSGLSIQKYTSHFYSSFGWIIHILLAVTLPFFIIYILFKNISLLTFLYGLTSKRRVNIREDSEVGNVDNSRGRTQTFSVNFELPTNKQLTSFSINSIQFNHTPADIENSREISKPKHITRRHISENDFKIVKKHRTKSLDRNGGDEKNFEL